MKTNEKKLFAIEIISLVLLLLDIFVTNILNDFGLIVFLLLLIGVVIISFGYSRNRNLYIKDIVLNIVIYCFIYYIVLYLSGIFIGFLRTSYNLSIVGIFKNVFPVICFIMVSEFLRYVLISKCSKSRILIVITCILCTFIDVKFISYAYDLSTLIGVIKMGYMSFIPLLAKNIFLTYLCYRFGYVPNYIYCLFMGIPTYMIPIVPDLGDYFTTVIDFLFPMMLLYLVYKEFNKKKKEIKRNDKTQRLGIVIVGVFISTIIILTSGVFKYYVLAIGSDSMAKAINKGDVVLVEKVKPSDMYSLKSGEVLVYKHNDVTIVHRIVKAFSENGNYYFITKGDNNNSNDNFTISQDMVVGRAIFRIPYVGTPTVWLNEKV